MLSTSTRACTGTETAGVALGATTGTLRRLRWGVLEEDALLAGVAKDIILCCDYTGSGRKMKCCVAVVLLMFLFLRGVSRFIIVDASEARTTQEG